MNPSLLMVVLVGAGIGFLGGLLGIVLLVGVLLVLLSRRAIARNWIA